MKKALRESLKAIMVLSAVFFICGIVSIIEQGTGIAGTITCFVVCPLSFKFADMLGAFEGYEE